MSKDDEYYACHVDGRHREANALAYFLAGGVGLLSWRDAPGLINWIILGALRKSILNVSELWLSTNNGLIPETCRFCQAVCR
jgi:hypothetical protein